MQASLDAGLLVAVEEEDEEDARLLSHLAAPRRQVVLVAREAVDQEVVAACVQVRNPMGLKKSSKNTSAMN